MARRQFLFWVAPWLCLTGVACGEESPAQRTLAAANLQLAGRYWLCPEEVELRRQLEQFPKAERTFTAANLRFRQLIGQYQEIRGRLTTLKSQLEEGRSQLTQTSAGTLQRQQLEAETARISEQITKAEQMINTRLNVVDESSEMTTAAIEFANARNALAVCLLAINGRMSELADRYEQLASDKKIAAAIDELDANQSLGPAENYEATARRKIARLWPQIFTDGVPIYRRSGQFRLSLIAGEQTPITFSYFGFDSPTLIPASLAKSAGAVFEEGAPPGKFEEGDRKLATRRATLPTLRLGRFVIHNLPVEILPPEAEDLGARISQTAFGDHPAKLDENQLWLKLKKEAVKE